MYKHKGNNRVCIKVSMLIYILKKQKVAIVTYRLQKFSKSDVLD